MSLKTGWGDEFGMGEFIGYRELVSSLNLTFILFGKKQNHKRQITNKFQLTNIQLPNLMILNNGNANQKNKNDRQFWAINPV